jgi:integrase
MQEVYSLKPILDLISSWGKTNELTIEQLQQKTVLLIAIATMWRPRSDLGTLQTRDIQFSMQNNVPTAVTLMIREPKERHPKKSFLGIIGEEEMCPVRTLWTFLNESNVKRTHLPEDHTLFLAYVDCPTKHPSSVRPVTIANWVKSHMERAGIDTTKFKAHSIRAAASTRAVQAGIPIQTVKIHAGWSLRTSTFEEVYLKPREQHVRGQQILETMFA